VNTPIVKNGRASRWIENGLAVLGGLIAAAYVVGVEIYPAIAFTTAPSGHGFPWGVVILVAALVLPKTVGRATAGKVWDVIGGRAK
jgi:hypothetical protein